MSTAEISDLLTPVTKLVMYSVELVVAPVDPQVTPIHANSLEVASGAGDSARVPGTEMTAAGALDPDIGPLRMLPLHGPVGWTKKTDSRSSERTICWSGPPGPCGLTERMREPLTVEYTPTPPFPSPATNSAGAGWRFPCGGVHLGKPTCG